MVKFIDLNNRRRASRDDYPLEGRGGKDAELQLDRSDVAVMLLVIHTTLYSGRSSGVCRSAPKYSTGYPPARDHSAYSEWLLLLL